jgi:hypothetical protein
MRAIIHFPENDPRNRWNKDKEENKVNYASPVVVNMHYRDNKAESGTDGANRVDYRSEKGRLV